MFKSMLRKTRSHLQPFIFLHGVKHEDMEAILDFMYNGEVSVNQDDLRSFLSVAEELRVRGLTQMDLDNNRKTEQQQPDAEQLQSRKRPASPTQKTETESENA